jgi:predicted nucleic acid-binding Zn ribbon protein
VRPLAGAVNRALRALRLDGDVARADAVRAWPDAAARVLGPDARETRAVRADGDTLVVVVPTSHWAGEIRLRERELIAALAASAPASGITRLRPAPGTAEARPAR